MRGICLPVSYTPSDSTGKYVFLYDNHTHLSEIQYLINNVVINRYFLSYSNGRVSKCTYLTPVEEGKSYLLRYGSNDLPVTRLHYDYPGNLVDSTTFAYDANNRLTKVIYSDYYYTYIYGQDNNITAISFTSTYGNKVPLPDTVVKYTSYDNRRLFYSESKDLSIVEVYIFGELPNANNLLARTDTYSSANGGPVIITSQYEYEYDSKGNTISKMVTYGTGNKQSVFTNMNYSCQ